MVESVREHPGQDFHAGLVWLRGQRERVLLLTIQGGEDHEARYSDALADVREGRRSEGALWDYLAGQGGNGYTCLRTVPETIEASDVLRAMIAVLARFGPPPVLPLSGNGRHRAGLRVNSPAGYSEEDANDR